MGKNNENPPSASANGKIIKNGASHSEPLESSTTNAEAPNNDKPTEEKPKKLSNLSKGDKEEITKIIKDYYKDMKGISAFPDDFSGKKFEIKDIRVLSTRANRKKRNEFNNQKEKLRKEWSEKHHQEWPTYTEDFYAKSGKLIRQKGQPYDMHHIQPLSLGGKNTCDNMTPFHAKDHYDRQGIHANGGAYDRLSKKVKSLNSN
ncbi:MAG: HNH endonuclease [Paludibacteraceae bacterium]|nr:HNH endonuclease [Paludibacteraceae bacterium]